LLPVKKLLVKKMGLRQNETNVPKRGKEGKPPVGNAIRYGPEEFYPVSRR